MDSSIHLREQCRQHALHPQDAVKLCYQAAFGAEHLLSDPAAAAAYFDTEFTAVPARSGVLCEPISDAFCRVHLAVWKFLGLPPSWLFSLFRLTAEAGAPPDAAQSFTRSLQTVETLAVRGETPFSAQEFSAFRSDYLSNGVRPLHHSAPYREAEQPAYRVVSARFARTLPLLQGIAALPASAAAATVAVDGRSAAGKTTLSADFAAITGAGVVHMDDFFLPPDLRTDARSAQPGGNVHYERFLDEVVPFLHSPAAFTYRVFDCQTQRFRGTRTVCASPWRIVEGAYSCRPEWNAAIDLRVFCDISPAAQLRRIRIRNGAEAAELFRTQWIPMEEHYFRTYQIPESADIRLSAESTLSGITV